MIKRGELLAVELRMIPRDRWKKNLIELLTRIQKVRCSSPVLEPGLQSPPVRQGLWVVHSTVDVEEVLPRVIAFCLVIVGEETISAFPPHQLMVSWYSY
jgi:hypothetical protein